MILGRNEDGSGYIKLSPEEYDRFLAGENIVSLKGDRLGDSWLSVSIQRKDVFFLIAPSGHGRAVGDTLFILAKLYDPDQPSDEAYDQDEYEEVERFGSLKDSLDFCEKHFIPHPEIV